MNIKRMESRQMESNKNTERKVCRVPKWVKAAFVLYAVRILCLCLGVPAVAASTATSDPLTVVNNLSNFVFALIRAIGLILLGWGIVQVGLSLQSHDPSQRSNGFLTLAGGVIITFAQEILNLITGTP